VEDEYDSNAFDAEHKNTFQNNSNASNLALDLYYQGHKDLASISEQFKSRNYNSVRESPDALAQG